MITVYTNEDGYKYMVMVPANTLPEFYRLGAILGPPDLSELRLSAADLKALNNKLVEREVYDGRTLDRKVVREVLKELNITLDERWITSIFIREYF